MDVLRYRPSPAQGSFLVAALALVFQPILVGDLFGYLVYGEWMIENGAITTVDRYSFTAQGARWVNHEWLFQIGLASVRKVLGWYGLLVFQFLFVGSVLYLVAAFVDRKTERFSAWAFSISCPILALVPGLTLRPQLFTYLAILVTVALLYEDRGITVLKSFGFVVLYAVWANVHGGVLVGLAFLGFMLVRRVVLEPGTFTRAIGLFAVCSLVTLINPYGLELWSVLVGTIGDPMTAVFIEEWRPTWEYPYHMAVWSLLGIQWTGGFLRLDRSRTVEDGLRAFCLLGVAVLSLWPRRNLTYYGLAVAAFAPPVRIYMEGFRAVGRTVGTGLRLGGYLAGVVLLVLTFRAGFNSGARHYPSELLDRIPEQSPRRVFVDYPLSQWAFYRRDNVRVFLDGRWKNVYPDDVIRDYGKILLGEQNLLERYGTGWVLLRERYPLHVKLAEARTWTFVAGRKGYLLWRHDNEGDHNG